jgi:hypothetical protein
MNFTSKTKNITIIKFQYLFTIFSAILLSSLYVSNALETNYLNKSGVTVLKSTEEELIIRYKPILQELRQEKFGNIQVIKPSILGVSSNSYLQNSPNNLAITADITLPSMNGFSIKDIKIGKVNIIDGILSPFENGYAVSLKENNPNISANELINNYTQFPTPEWVELKYKGVARNRYAGSLKIVAARFNTETNKIEIPEEITVSIKFDTPKYNVTPNNKKSSLVGLNLFNTLNSNVVSKFIEFRTFDNGLEKSLYDLANDGLSNKKVGKTLEQEKLSSGNWFKIEIPKTGLYRISLSQLQELGFNPNNDDINTIKIFGNGGRHLNENQPSALFNKLNEQEIVLDKTNGTLNSIIFFAEGAIGFRIDNESLYDRKPENKIRHYINPFANTASYLLTWGGKSGKRASFVENNNSPINTPKVYTNSIVTNEETTMIFPEGSGRLFVGRSNLSEPFRNLLHNLDRSGNILYRVQVANKDVNSSNFTFLENENELAKNIIVNGQGNYEYVHANYNEFEFTGSAANVSADNRSAFKINFANKSSTVITFFDYLEIHYPRSLVAIDNEIEIFTDKTLNGTTQYNISGFEGNKYGVDITDITNPIFIKNSANDADKFIFNTDLVQNEPKRFFAASKTNTPNISRIEFANLREDFANSNVILITHKDLMGSALKFKEYRESVSNLKIAIIDVEHIMNEFASGMSDPTAIRDFLAFALQNWTTKPEYLIMWGKGHFDYRGITSKTKSYVPVYEIDAPFNISRGERPEVNEINSSCFDDYFTRLVGNDDLIDIALGRVPIDAPSVGFDFVEKIKHYEKNSANDEWRTSTIMLADDGPTWKGNDGATHINQTEGLVNDYVPHTFYTNKIYLPEYPTVFLSNSERSRRKPAVTPFLLDKINNSGSLIYNFIGHGNPKVMTHEQVFDRNRDILQMNNYDKLFFLTAATCDFAKFDNPTFRDGTSDLIFSTKGGAIGGLAASRVVYSSQNEKLNNLFYDILFTQNQDGSYKTLGEVGYLLKQQMYDSNSEKYFIFGDPTMTLLMPKYKVAVSQLNDINIDSIQNKNLKAITNNKFKGIITLQDGKTKAENFNGEVSLTIYDTDKKVTIKDEASTYSFSKYGGLLSKTKADVKNGEFEVEFVLPKDVNFEEEFIRINLFATNDNNEHALGGVNNFNVNGVDSSVANDGVGPEIKLFMNNRAFKDGDLVGTNSLLYADLYDAIGINSTGNGIGRKIEAWIDESPVSVDLTPNYKTDEVNYRFGSAFAELRNLKTGKHKAKVRAWDLFNNFSTSEINFVVKPDIDGLVLSNATNYPNPFNQFTTIAFSHNATTPYDLVINIYSAVGSLVKTVNITNSNSQNIEYVWDATDNLGNTVPNGSYIYSVNINNEFLNIDNGVQTGTLMIYINE